MQPRESIPEFKSINKSIPKGLPLLAFTKNSFEAFMHDDDSQDDESNSAQWCAAGKGRSVLPKEHDVNHDGDSDKTDDQFPEFKPDARVTVSCDEPERRGLLRSGASQSCAMAW